MRIAYQNRTSVARFWYGAESGREEPEGKILPDPRVMSRTKTLLLRVLVRGTAENDD
jgi:hypothetical protein